MRLDKHRKGEATKQDENYLFQDILNALSKEVEIMEHLNRQHEL